MRRFIDISELKALARSQWGIFSSAQAGKAGVPGGKLACLKGDGAIEKLAPGIYRFDDIPTAHPLIKGNWISVYPKKWACERNQRGTIDAVAAGSIAAYVHGIAISYKTPYKKNKKNQYKDKSNA